MSVQVLIEQLRRNTNEELLRLVLEPDQFTGDAWDALQTELASRGITDDDIDRFLIEEQQRRDNEAQEQKFRKLQEINVRYISVGKANESFDPHTDTEQYNTTYFFHIAELPLAPIGSYRVQRQRSDPEDVMVLRKVRLNWRQAWPTCIVSGVTLVLLIWALKLLWGFFVWAAR